MAHKSKTRRFAHSVVHRKTEKGESERKASTSAAVRVIRMRRIGKSEENRGKTEPLATSHAAPELQTNQR
jgi:hypothetical protein